MPKVALCIPVLNAQPYAEELVSAIRAQSRQPDRVLLIDSESDDAGLQVLAGIADEVIHIKRRDFDHGGTRNLAFSAVSSDFYLFLTQDALPADSQAFENLCGALEADGEVGLAYGRQLPRLGAEAHEAHARLFNYGPEPRVKRLEDVRRFGVKTYFCSNSFAAYRRSAIEAVGFFRRGLIVAEDHAAAASMLLKGWSIAYVPEARVWHSHRYGFSEEFGRYFDHGVSHARSRWLLDRFGGPGGEGMRFVRSELRHCWSEGGFAGFGEALARNMVRWLGYRVGRAERNLPGTLKAHLTRNKGFWRDFDSESPGQIVNPGEQE